MGRHLHLQPHLSIDELERRSRRAKEPHERSWWRSGQILWLLAQGRTATELAGVTGYSAYWIGQLAKRYNTQGPAGPGRGPLERAHRGRVDGCPPGPSGLALSRLDLPVSAQTQTASHAASWSAPSAPRVG
jgi:hypothetical protein